MKIVYVCIILFLFEYIHTIRTCYVLGVPLIEYIIAEAFIRLS